MFEWIVPFAFAALFNLQVQFPDSSPVTHAFWTVDEIDDIKEIKIFSKSNASTEYDILEHWSFNHLGQLILDGSGVHRSTFSYDEEGRFIQENYLGRLIDDGSVTKYTHYEDSLVQQEYEEGRLIRKRVVFFDTNREVIHGNHCYFSSDGTKYFSVDSVSSSVLGYAQYRHYSRDEAEEFELDVEQKITKTDSGACVIKNYFEDGKLGTSTTLYLDNQGRIIHTASSATFFSSATTVNYSYDPSGKLFEVRYDSDASFIDKITYDDGLPSFLVRTYDDGETHDVKFEYEYW